MDLFCFQLLADEGEAWHVYEGADQEFMIFSLLGTEPFPQPWNSPGTLTPAPPPTQTSVSLQPKKVSFLWKASNRRGWVQICMCLWIYSGRKVKAKRDHLAFKPLCQCLTNRLAFRMYWYSLIFERTSLLRWIDLTDASLQLVNDKIFVSGSVFLLHRNSIMCQVRSFPLAQDLRTFWIGFILIGN